VLSHELRATLLGSAGSDLRAIRNRLSLPVVAWNTFWRRDERTVWQPHWHLATRQGFRDGVCVAELLVAVKQRLNERDRAGRHGETAREPGGLPGPARSGHWAERFRQRKGLQVVSAIAGDARTVRTVLRAPSGEWPAGEGSARATASGGRTAPTRDRVRWLPWQRRTASWTAAYNTACLYAVLVRAGLADEDRVIASLRRVVLNRDSGLERPHDWISNDPDFAPLLAEDSPYRRVRAFLEAQERRDYPMRQVHQHLTAQYAIAQVSAKPPLVLGPCDERVSHDLLKAYSQGGRAGAAGSAGAGRPVR
jgi:hypothetical protein